MRYAVVHKPESEPLDQFIKPKGGINECAARFSRWVGGVFLVEAQSKEWAARAEALVDARDLDQCVGVPRRNEI
jgi:hypothetical protein